MPLPGGTQGVDSTVRYSSGQGGHGCIAATEQGHSSSDAWSSATIFSRPDADFPDGTSPAGERVERGGRDAVLRLGLISPSKASAKKPAGYQASGPHKVRRQISLGAMGVAVNAQVTHTSITISSRDATGDQPDSAVYGRTLGAAPDVLPGRRVNNRGQINTHSCSSPVEPHLRRV